MSKYISVGKILNFHGIKGEARVGCSQNRQDFFVALDSVFIKKGHEYIELKIENSRVNKKFIIVKFEGINSVNDILEYKGCILFTPESVVRQTLEEDEFLIDELVGIDVFDIKDESKLGFVIGVSNNGANDLLSVKTLSKKICLIPFVKAIVPVVDIANKKILINNIEGLLE